MIALLTMKVAQEQDLVAIRQRTRQVSATLGFESQDQTRLATAVSEICRNARNAPAYRFGPSSSTAIPLG